MVKVRIFLDSRDLINLLEARGPCSVGEFRALLLAGDHQVVLSPTVVFEVAAPIVEPSSATVVTQLLNDLERTGGIGSGGIRGDPA